MSTPNGGAVIRRVEIGVGVSSSVDTVAVLNRKSRREVLVISYARGSDVAESVTIVVGAIGSMATGTADTAVEVDVRIGSDCSFLNGTIGEVRSSNVVVWIDAGIDVVGAWTETVVVVTCSMGSDGIEWVEAIADIVSRGSEAKTQHSVVGVVICSQSIDSVNAKIPDWIASSPPRGSRPLEICLFFCLTQLHASHMHGVEESLHDWLRPYRCLN